MFENIMNFFKKLNKKEDKEANSSKVTAKERLHLVLMQDRANVSADFLELMKQEIIEVIKKYIDVDEEAIDVRLTNKENEDGTNGAPALYANIPIVNIKNEAKAEVKIEEMKKEEEKQEENRIVSNNNETIKKEEIVTQPISNSNNIIDTNSSELQKEENTKEELKSENIEE